MRLRDNYTQALIPTPYVVLGVVLRPFSLGHSMCFERFDIALPGDDEFDEEDFALGLFFLEKNWDEIRRATSGALFYELDRFKDKVFKWYHRTSTYCKALDTYREYFVENTVGPDLLTKERSNPSEAPYAELVYASLKKAFKYTDSEIFDMPLSLIPYRMGVMGEDEGEARFNSRDSEQKKEEALAAWHSQSNLD
jgi:hypothetical protein